MMMNKKEASLWEAFFNSSSSDEKEDRKVAVMNRRFAAMVDKNADHALEVAKDAATQCGFPHPEEVAKEFVSQYCW